MMGMDEPRGEGGEPVEESKRDFACQTQQRRRRKALVPWRFRQCRGRYYAEAVGLKAEEALKSSVERKESPTKEVDLMGLRDEESPISGEKMENSSVKEVDLKGSKDWKSNGHVRIKYKQLVPWRFQWDRLGCPTKSPGLSKEDSSKSSKKSLGLDGDRCIRSSQTPKPGNQASSRVSELPVSMETAHNSAEEESLASVNGLSQSHPPVTSVESRRSQMPRRYPSHVRVSAVRSFPSCPGKYAMDGSKNDSAKSEEKAQMGAAAYHSTTGKDEVVQNSTRKRKSEDEAHHVNEAIKCLRKDSTLHVKEGAPFSMAQAAGESILEGNNQSSDVVARDKVKEVLHEFQRIFKMLEEEELKPNESEQDRRTDLVAFRLFREKHKGQCNGLRYVGSVPGVEVGDKFHLRVELCVVGLHQQHRLGIDFIKRDGKNIALSIVTSGQCADRKACSDVLTYSSSGAFSEDQKLDGGDLALKNSMDTKTPVRVIYGFIKYPYYSHGLKGKKKLATYIYDGLYIVDEFCREKGDDNQYVSMFRLRRIPGQPKLHMKELISNRGLYIKDISQGKEKVPISVENSIDTEHPMPFKYIVKMIYPPQYLLTPPRGCGCIDGCSDSEKCACAVKNGGEIPFNYKDAIVKAKPLVFECSPSCKCPPSCHNRVSQYGVKFPLQIFKTKSMGWGVRSLTRIPSGSFICEYVGELLDDEEAQKRTNDEYLFAIGNNYYDESLWEGLSTSIPALQKGANSESEDVGFTVDASEYGNVGRFINHSCTPNLYAQNLLYDHDSKSMPHIMFFASEDIPPLQELTYHYNYTIDQVHDSNGNIKKKNCYCGSVECTGRLY